MRAGPDGKLAQFGVKFKRTKPSIMTKNYRDPAFFDKTDKINREHSKMANYQSALRTI